MGIRLYSVGELMGMMLQSACELVGMMLQSACELVGMMLHSAGELVGIRLYSVGELVEQTKIYYTHTHTHKNILKSFLIENKTKSLFSFFLFPLSFFFLFWPFSDQF